ERIPVARRNERVGREDLVKRAAETVPRNTGSVRRQSPAGVEGGGEDPDGASSEQGEEADLTARAVNLGGAFDSRQGGDLRRDDAGPARRGGGQCRPEPRPNAV